MNWTQEQLEEYKAKQPQLFNDQHIHWKDAVTDEPDPGPESDLQNRILNWCRQKGYPVWHDWSRNTNQAGWPDLTIYMPEGKILLIELKSGNKKLRKEQQELRKMLAWLNHNVHVVRSFKHFMEIAYD